MVATAGLPADAAMANREKTTMRRAIPKKAGGSRAKGEAAWTVMVYLAGDNNLDAAGTTDLLEMKKVGSGPAINVVAQFDRAGNKGTTKRYLLRKGTSLAADVVADLGETNTGDPAVLRDFLKWGVKSYPARHYLVVLWNHGAGWDDSNLYAAGGDYFSGDAPPVIHKGYTLDARGGVNAVAVRRRQPARPVPLAQARAAARRARRALFRTSAQKMAKSRAICFDDQAMDYLDNAEMKRVLLEVKRLLKRRIDVIGFDACLMSMLEVGYQVKGGAAYAVGSQEEEPNNGWPYDRVLGALAKNPDMAPADLARGIVGGYLASYAANAGVTFSATDLGKVDDLASAVNGLGTALVKAMKNAAVAGSLQSVRARVQEYTAPYDEYVDLVDLCDGLTRLVADGGVRKACAGVKTAVGAAILQSGAKGANVARSNGTSIYFPKKKVSSLYKTLDFARKNAWSKFIDAYAASLASRGWD